MSDAMNLYKLCWAAMNEKAARLSGKGANWKPYLYESVANGMLVTGCATRPKKSGKRKGEPHYLLKTDEAKVLITRAMMNAIEKRAAKVLAGDTACAAI